ncbi:hypothetical protein FKM82_016550 [Ascaphus truei]
MFLLVCWNTLFSLVPCSPVLPGLTCFLTPILCMCAYLALHTRRPISIKGLSIPSIIQTCQCSGVACWWPLTTGVDYP